MEYKQIKYEIKEHVLTITLNRPEKLNAFTDFVMVPELLDAFERADEDDDVRAVIVTGAGRGFCSGHDLNDGFDYDEQTEDSIDTHRDPGGVISLRIYEMKKPMIAAINGAAIGVGITMTLPMDIRLASEKAKFGFVFTKMGITLEACSSWFLPRIVGPGKALEWSCTGRIFDAKEALTAGLVNEVLPPEKLLDRAWEIAQEIAQSTSAIAIPLNRQLVWRMLGADHPMEAHRIESKCIYALGMKSDAKEAVEAFHARRPPEFSLKPGSDMPDFYPWWPEKPFS
ncbi:MAG: crotonase/enoyl-CoA hydratase family protein [Deltaproteobacteria bacterium]|nr:crotonase/enoyl-CoA hydratase family protein [Deltaproteobacteria bacterium]